MLLPKHGDQSIFVPTHNYQHDQLSKYLILKEMLKVDEVRNIKLAPKKHKFANATKSTTAAASETYEGTAAAVVKRGRPTTKTTTPSQPSCTSCSASCPRDANKDYRWCTKFGRTNPYDHVPKDKCWYNTSQVRYCPSGVCTVIQKYYNGKGKVNTAANYEWKARSHFADSDGAATAAAVVEPVPAHLDLESDDKTWE